jgi:subtilisin family serine protease
MSHELDVNEPRPRIVVKLETAVSQQATTLLWNQIEKDYPGTEIERTFQDTPVVTNPSAVLSDPGEPAFTPADLTRYYTLKMSPAVNLPSAIANLTQHEELAEVMEEERPSPPPQLATPAAAPAGLLTQPHLGPAPLGINAGAASARPGGRGQGMVFADMESGWNLDHVDLLDLHVQAPAFGVNCDDREHGTAVLGIVAAPGSKSGGVIGIAPELAAVKVVSPLRSCFGRREMAQAIRHMAQVLNPGDVLLLEAQISFSGVTDIPAEVVPFLADAILFAVSRGIVVIEPVGNKRVSLDTLKVERGRTLNPRDPNFQDSGAILVAAATADVPHRRHLDTSPTSAVSHR